MVTNNVSLTAENKPTTAFKMNSPGKGNDLISTIQKDLSTKLGKITLAHTEHTKDGRFSSKAVGFEDQADCRSNSKQAIQTLLSADCKTGKFYDTAQQGGEIHFFFML